MDAAAERVCASGVCPVAEGVTGLVGEEIGPAIMESLMVEAFTNDAAACVVKAVHGAWPRHSEARRAVGLPVAAAFRPGSLQNPRRFRRLLLWGN